MAYHHQRPPLSEDLIGTATLAVAVAGSAVGMLAAGAAVAQRIVGRVARSAPGSGGPVHPDAPCVVYHHYCCEWIPPRHGCHHHG